MISVENKTLTIPAEGGTVSFHVDAHASLPNGTKGKPIQWRCSSGLRTWLKFAFSNDANTQWTTAWVYGASAIEFPNFNETPEKYDDCTVYFKADKNQDGSERSVDITFTSKLYSGRTITATITVKQPAYVE